MSVPREGGPGKRGVSQGWHATSTNKRGHRHVKHRMRRSLQRSIRREAERLVQKDAREDRA